MILTELSARTTKSDTQIYKNLGEWRRSKISLLNFSDRKIGEQF